MVLRASVLTACLLASAAVFDLRSSIERVPPRDPLASVPQEFDGWRAAPAADIPANELAVLGVDDYINRLYFRSERVGVATYIGYYKTQRQGDTIHSPLNCLPGSGWEPLTGARVVVDVDADERVHQPVELNRFVVQKGIDRMVVLYWYQSHGRVVASEYWGKAYMVLDALRLNRTDGAIVRVISPVLDNEAGAEDRAGHVAIDFVRSIFPLLGRYLPA